MKSKKVIPVCRKRDRSDRTARIIFGVIIVLMGISAKDKAKAGRNQLFNRNEHKILHAFFKLLYIHRAYITARKVAEAAGLSRQTFYNHHSDINQAIIDGEETLLNNFVAELDIQDEKFSKMIPDTNKRIFYATFIFMKQHKDIFYLICAGINHQELLYQMAREVFSRLRLKWLPVGTPAPDISSERVSMCIRMMVEVISRWGADTRCDISKADRYIERLIRIIEATERNKLP